MTLFWERRHKRNVKRYKQALQETADKIRLKRKAVWIQVPALEACILGPAPKSVAGECSQPDPGGDSQAVANPPQ
jgi:hypothetical protein